MAFAWPNANFPRSSPSPSPSSPLLSPNTSPNPPRPSFTPSSENPLLPRGPWAVYTFLATLVLLLAVSGAIVARSFILRRRHRRLIEEAIRNGTWVPPSPGGTGGRRRREVDLSKRPRLWDVYLGQASYGFGGAGEGGGVSGGWTKETKEAQLREAWKAENGKDWEGMRPVAAGYAKPFPAQSAVDNTDVSANANGGGDEGGNAGSAGRWLRPRAMLSRVVHTLLIPPLVPTAVPNTNTPIVQVIPSHQQQQQQQQQQPPAQGEGQAIEMTELNPHHPSHLTAPTPVRVTVLIAMPAPSPASKATPAASSSDLAATSSYAADDDEQPLPHIEVGVAEVMVVPDSFVPSESGHGKGAGSEEGTVGGS